MRHAFWVGFLGLIGLCMLPQWAHAQLPHAWIANDLVYHDGSTQIAVVDLHFEAYLHKVNGTSVGEIVTETTPGCAVWEVGGETSALVEVSQFGDEVNPTWYWADGDTLWVWFFGLNPPGGGIDSCLVIDVQTVLDSVGQPNNPQYYPGPGDQGSVTVPVELSSFSGTVEQGNVVLRWTVASETDNLGFYVQRSEEREGMYARVSDLIPGRGTADTFADYSWTDIRPGGAVLYYKVEDVDFSGRSNVHDPIRVVLGGTSSWGQIKAEFSD